MWLWFSTFIYEENEGKSRYSVMYSPFIDYQITDKGAVRLWVEQYNDHDPNRAFVDAANSGLISYIGYDYNHNDYFGVKPYIATNLTNDESTRATSVGAWFWGKIF
jgi:hypothetical protein